MNNLLEAKVPKLTINQTAQFVEVPGDTPLLWVLREELGLLGTKFGCGKGLCGACTVHFDGQPIRACITPVSTVTAGNVTTIEGLSTAPGSHAVQQAWLQHDVVQCGYCQPGQIMAAASLIAQNHTPSDADIDSAMSGNLCRCGTYPRIREAVKTAAKLMAEAKS